MSGSLVENHAEQIAPGAMHQSTIALTNQAQAIGLGAAYRNLRIWLDASASACHIRINPDGTTTAATTAYPKYHESMPPLVYRFRRGVSWLYIRSTGETGNINIEAW